jgi:hypothetical protein
MSRTVVYDRIVAPDIHAVRGDLRVRIEALDRQARIAVDTREGWPRSKPGAPPDGRYRT